MSEETLLAKDHSVVIYAGLSRTESHPEDSPAGNDLSRQLSPTFNTRCTGVPALPL